MLTLIEPLLTAFARRDKENFLIHGKLTETKKTLLRAKQECCIMTD